jgi:GNAT superfamily N-acetyltransferase
VPFSVQDLDRWREGSEGEALMSDSATDSKKSSKVRIHEVRRFEDLPDWVDRQKLAVFLHESLKPYEDSLPDIQRGIAQALEPVAGERGFILIAEFDRRPVGALVMLRTGMSGFVPENILLWVAVDPSVRGKGVGSQIIRRSFELADGDVKLHVEYDNPAKHLYERLGMTTKYAEMRYTK